MPGFERGYWKSRQRRRPARRDTRIVGASCGLLLSSDSDEVVRRAGRDAPATAGRMPALGFGAAQGGGGQGTAQAHGFDCGRWHDYHCAFFFDGFVEHVHGAQMQGDGVLGVRSGSLHEAVGDFAFGLAEDDAGLTLALSLCLARHGILEALRDLHVANLDRLYGDAPRIGLLVEDALEFATESLALGDHLGEFVASDRLAQSGLGGESDGLDEDLDFEDRLLGIPDHPEDDGVDVDGDGVAGQGGFGRNAGDADSLVDVRAERFEYGNDVAHAGAAQADIAAETQDGDLLPLADDFDGEKEVEADEGSNDGGRRMIEDLGQREPDDQADCEK